MIGAESHEDFGPDAVTPEMLAEALRTFTPLSTSRPNPENFLVLYEALADQGFTAIISIHLSSQLSGTVESAPDCGKRLLCSSAGDRLRSRR
ncbi:MAG: DegV family protein [Marmoricola sp.]